MTYEDEQNMRALCACEAEKLWRQMDDNEQAMVRFGLLPWRLCQPAEQRGYDGRLLALALYDVAARNGGMIA